MASKLGVSPEDRRKLMLEAPVMKVIPMIALPMVISMLIDAFYNLADTYFVSTLGTAATAAVGVNSSLMFFIRAIAMGFGMGASSYISRLLGAKKNNEAHKVASTTAITSIGVITVCAVFAYIFKGPLVNLLGATETSRVYAMQYAQYILFAAPFTAGENVFSQVLRAEGSTTRSMVGILSGCFVNLILDPIFIFNFGWGVAGAAAATAISKVISFAVLLYPFIAKKTMVKIAFKFNTPTWGIYKEVARMGIPNFLRAALMSVSSVVTNNLAAGFGDSVLAACSVSVRIMMFVGSMVIGFGQGFQPIAGYCWGAKRYGRIKKAFWSTSLLGAIVCLVCGTAIFIFAGPIIGIFTKSDTEILELGKFMIRLQCLTLLAHVWSVVINGLFQAIGRALSATIMSLSRSVICLIPCLLIMSTIWGKYGLCSAQAAADVLSIIIAIPLLINILRELTRLEKEHPLEEIDAAEVEESAKVAEETMFSE